MKKDAVVADLEADHENLTKAEVAAADLEEISAQEKCTRQRVLNADRNVKFLLSQQKENQSFAKIAIEIEKVSKKSTVLIFFLFYLAFL